MDHTLRLEPLLRSAFFGLMTPSERADHFDREAAYFSALAVRYRDVANAKDRGEHGSSPQTQSLRMTVAASIRVNQALSD